LYALTLRDNVLISAVTVIVELGQSLTMRPIESSIVWTRYETAKTYYESAK